VVDGELVSTPVKARVVLLPGPRETTVVSDTVLWPVMVGRLVVIVTTLLLPPPMPKVVVSVTWPLPPFPLLFPEPLPEEVDVVPLAELVVVEREVAVVVVVEVEVTVDEDVDEEVVVPLMHPTG